MPLDFKYKEYLDVYDKCFHTTCKETDRPAFRWVFANINHKDNFKPQYFKPEFIQHPKKDCRGYGLSLFDKHDQAKAALIKRCQDKENLFKVIGTHIAGGTLNKIEGVSGDSAANGHFTFFEYVGVDLTKSFTIQEKIYGDD